MNYRLRKGGPRPENGDTQRGEDREQQLLWSWGGEAGSRARFFIKRREVGIAAPKLSCTPMRRALAIFPMALAGIAVRDRGRREGSEVKNWAQNPSQKEPLEPALTDPAAVSQLPLGTWPDSATSHSS